MGGQGKDIRHAVFKLAYGIVKYALFGPRQGDQNDVGVGQRHGAASHFVQGVNGQCDRLAPILRRRAKGQRAGHAAFQPGAGSRVHDQRAGFDGIDGASIEPRAVCVQNEPRREGRDHGPRRVDFQRQPHAIGPAAGKGGLEPAFIGQIIGDTADGDPVRGDRNLGTRQHFQRDNREINGGTPCRGRWVIAGFQQVRHALPVCDSRDAARQCVPVGAGRDQADQRHTAVIAQDLDLEFGWCKIRSIRDRQIVDHAAGIDDPASR